MAKKRAKVDATLAATRSSGIFTEDLEDIRHDAAEAIAESDQATRRTKEEQEQVKKEKVAKIKAEAEAEKDTPFITLDQNNMLYNIARKLKKDSQLLNICGQFGFEEVKQITKSQLGFVLDGFNPDFKYHEAMEVAR